MNRTQRNRLSRVRYRALLRASRPQLLVCESGVLSDGIMRFEKITPLPTPKVSKPWWWRKL